MFSMPATTYGQTLPPITLALSQGVASATTIGSIPSRAVYSAIALPELQNQRGGGAAYTAVSGVATAATQPVASAAQNLARIQSAGGSADYGRCCTYS